MIEALTFLAQHQSLSLTLTLSLTPSLSLSRIGARSRVTRRRSDSSGASCSSSSRVRTRFAPPAFASAMDKECCTPGPPSKGHLSAGKEESLCGLDTYINWPAGSTKAVIFVSDVFGWKMPLFRKFADSVAAAGFVAVVPDYLRGDPVGPDDFTNPAFNRAEWFSKHRFEPIAEDSLKIIKALKEKGITSVGMAGYCFGGKVAVLVAKDGVLDTTVILHPSMITVDDIKAVKGPLSILAAELDKMTPVSLVKECEKYLASKNEIDYFVKVFPGVDHGWTVRYDDKNENAVKSANESITDTIDWFKKKL